LFVGGDVGDHDVTGKSGKFHRLPCEGPAGNRWRAVLGEITRRMAGRATQNRLREIPPAGNTIGTRFELSDRRDALFRSEERAPSDGEVDAENEQQKNRNADDEQSFPELGHSILLKLKLETSGFDFLNDRRVRNPGQPAKASFYIARIKRAWENPSLATPFDGTTATRDYGIKWSLRLLPAMRLHGPLVWLSSGLRLWLALTDGSGSRVLGCTFRLAAVRRDAASLPQSSRGVNRRHCARHRGIDRRQAAQDSIA